MHVFSLRTLALLLTLTVTPTLTLAGNPPAPAGSVPLISFAPSAGWSIWWPADRGPVPFRVIQEGSSQIYEFAPQSEKRVYTLYSEASRKPMLADPKHLTLTVAADRDCEASASLSLLDEQKEGFTLPGATIAGRDTVIQWDLPRQLTSSWGDQRNGKIDGKLHVHELYLDIPASTVPTRIRLSEIRVSGLAEPLHPMQGRLDVGDEHYVVTPRSGQHVRIMFSSVPTGGTTVDLKVSNPDGATEYNTKVRLTPDPSGNARLDLPADYPTLGIKYVDVTTHLPTKGQGSPGLASSGGSEPLQMSFAYLTPPGPPAAGQSFLFGLQGEADDKWVRAAARAGAAMIRTGIDFRDIRPTEASDWNFSAPDRRIALIRQLGMQPQVLVAYGIPWATVEKYKEYRTDERGNHVQLTDWPHGFLYPVRDEVWEELCRRTARRYKGQVKYYEIWNEPDMTVFWRGSAEEYGHMLGIAYRAIKSEDPDAIVGTAGFAFSTEPEIANAGGTAGFQEQILRDDQSIFDWHIAHLHGDFPSFAHRVDSFLLPSRAKLHVHQPLFFNETAYSQVLRSGEREQAETLVKKVIYAWSRGAVGHLWFTTWTTPDQVPGEYGYSMFRGYSEDAQPKAVWPAYCVLSSQIRGKAFLRQLQMGEGDLGFVIENGTEKLVYFWHEDAQKPQSPLLLNVGSDSEATLIDIMGNETPIRVTDGRVVLTPSQHVQALRVRGPHPLVADEKPLLALAHPAEASDDRESSMQLRLANPLTHPVKVSLKLAMPGEAIDTSTRTRDLLLSANHDQLVTFALPKLSPQTTRYTLPAVLAYSFENSPWTGRLNIPLRMTRTLPNRPAGTRAPDFIVADRANVHDFFEGNPEKAKLLWAGPADLSYRVWLWRDADNLELEVRVVDNKHYNPFKGQDIWRGDGVQLAFAIDGQPGYWELGVAQSDDGSVQQTCWTRPRAGTSPEAAMQSEVTPVEGGMLYRITIPLQALEMTPAQASDGFGFNIAVADSDSADGRKAAMELAPGIVLTKDPTSFVRVRLP